MAAPHFAPDLSFPETDPLALTVAADKPSELRVVDPFVRHRSEHKESFSLDARTYLLDDGTRYDVQIFQPDTPQFDTAVTYTTPWCTDLGGFNQLMGEALAQAGMVAIAISPERLKGSQLLRRFGSLALEHDVHAQLAVLQDIDSETRSQPAVSLDIGYSRGAMIGLGINAYAKKYDRHIRYSDFIDPCLAHSVGIRDVSWHEIPGYLGKETLALAKGLAHTPLSTVSKIGRYAIPPSACFWLQQVAVGKALFNGQAGDFITEMHPETVGHVTLYTSSRFNHADEYETVLSKYPNMVIRRETGYHMSGVEPHVRQSTLGRVVLVQNLLQDNASSEELAGAVRSTAFAVN